LYLKKVFSYCISYRNGQVLVDKKFWVSRTRKG